MACPRIAIELTPVQADPSGSCVLLICSPFICVLVFFQFILGACETLLLQSSVSLMNDFPDISITPPLHQFSDQQPLQMVYFNQIYQCVRLYLIEESMNFKFLKNCHAFHWWYSLTKCKCKRINSLGLSLQDLSIHPSKFLEGTSALSHFTRPILTKLCLLCAWWHCLWCVDKQTKDIRHIYTQRSFESDWGNNNCK